MKKSTIWLVLANICLLALPAQALCDWVFVEPDKPLELNLGLEVRRNELIKFINEESGPQSPLLDALLYAPLRENPQDLLTRQDGKVIFWRSSSELEASVKSIKSISTSAIEHCILQSPRSRAQAWEDAYSCLRELDQNQKTLFPENTTYALYVVEPVLDMVDRRYKKRADKYQKKSQKRAEKADKSTSATEQAFIPASLVWPAGDPGWHLGADFSQLINMRESVGTLRNITAAHLDTGYLPSKEILPENFDPIISATCSKDGCSSGNAYGHDGYASDGILKSPGHGASTLSTLAGPAYRLNREKVQLGAAPDLEVFSVDISESVIHLDSRRMAEGIKYAIENGADIITISNGGLPSARLIDAVNLAYENGTVIFSAAGNHFNILFGHTFNEVVYPARYYRVMGVAGATHINKSYADRPSLIQLLWPGKGYFSRFKSWALRGNYGPADVMSEGVITAYTPNITRGIPTPSDPKLIGHNGAGTSHATPQVAAAAAYWLQNNYERFIEEDTWRSWKKSEAVYTALSKSADTCFENFNVKQYGSGLLKGSEAIKYHYRNYGLVTDKGEKIPIKIRDEAGPDIQGIISLLQSLKFVTSFSDSFRPTVVNALSTELRQLALTSNKIQTLLSQSNTCKVVDGCHICRNEDLIINLGELAQRVGNLKEASPTIKGVLLEMATVKEEIIIH